jgi:hypothetical protein
MKIGYFEAWNAERPCLNMRADQIPTNRYTYIHFAFADVTEDFKIDVSKVQDEFYRFKKLEGAKKIISLGGWAFVSVTTCIHLWTTELIYARATTQAQSIFYETLFGRAAGERCDLSPCSKVPRE